MLNQSILIIRISNWVICVVMSKFFILVLNRTNADYVQKLTGKKLIYARDKKETARRLSSNNF